MKELSRIQTICRVIKIILGVFAVILCVMLVAIALGIILWCICAEKYINGGSGPLVRLIEALDAGGFTSTLVLLLTDFIFCLGQLVIIGSIIGYLKKELSDGTPFTSSGARKLRNVGMRCISASLLSQSAIFVLCEIYYLNSAYTVDVGTVAVGLLLILFSFVLRLGAEKSQEETE